MSYNNQYKHITVKLSSLNLVNSLIHVIVHMLLTYCTKNSLAYKFYKDNRMITTNNITRVCAR